MPDLEAGQWRARAEVDAVAERHDRPVAALDRAGRGRGAVRVEAIGVGERRGVAVARPPQHLHDRALGHWCATDLGVAGGHPEDAAHRGIEPEDLLDERRDALGFGAQALLEGRPLAEQPDAGGDRLRRRLLAAAEEEHQEPEHGAVVERVALPRCGR